MKSYEELYCALRTKFGGELFLDLDVMEYLDEPELRGKYRGLSFAVRGLYDSDLNLDFKGSNSFALQAMISTISEFIGESPVCSYDVVDYATLEKRYSSVEWSHNKNRKEELDKDPTISQWTIARNIAGYDQGKHYRKKQDNV